MGSYNFTDTRTSCIHSHPTCDACLDQIRRDNTDVDSYCRCGHSRRVHGDEASGAYCYYLHEGTNEFCHCMGFQQA